MRINDVRDQLGPEPDLELDSAISDAAAAELRRSVRRLVRRQSQRGPRIESLRAAAEWETSPAVSELDTRRPPMPARP